MVDLCLLLWRQFLSLWNLCLAEAREGQQVGMAADYLVKNLDKRLLMMNE